ncbi:Excisionase/Xis, DNA-binding domain protein [mine drainage metagenome]|uniref:Excisionase/Xis, DNA-binding domain protein n=1 Tax=mine drainage metagenome TaxID=410659 RepID=T0Z2Y7_9ZZZZ
MGEGIPLAEPWASVEEVAKHLGVAKDSVYRWIDHRGLPAHKIGRLWKFKLSEVDHWVAPVARMLRMARRMPRNEPSH